MTLLGAARIRAALTTGTLVCTPPPATVEGAQIDLRIGRYYWRPRAASVVARTLNGYHVPDDPRAPVAPVVDLATVDPRQLYTLVDATLHGNVLEIAPHSMILAHTEEFAGTTVRDITSMLYTRSTPARLGLCAHVAAGWGDPGFCGRWTLEVFNFHPWAVTIPLGGRFCQIAFQEVDDNDVDYPMNARYNWDPDLWQPESMLPRPGNW